MASERYEGQVVRARLKKVSNEAVNVDAVERKAALRRGSDGYIRKVHNLEGHALVSTREICEGFREHLSERFTQLPGLRVDEFGSYLADSPRLTAARAASCDGLVTEHEVITALRQVGCNKSPGLDGLPYEFYLRLSPMLVPILKDVFNHWFAQGSIPGQVTKGVITLLRKGKRHGGEENFDDFRPLTLLNTELKILAKILANRLQVVITDLIEPDQSYAVKGRSIQDNLHLIRSIIEGTEDDAEAALISLDQSKAFDRVDHRFLGSVLEAAGFNPDFRKWIFVLYDRPTVAVQVNGKLSESFAVSRSVRQGCPLSPLLYILALEPLLRNLRDEATTPVLRGIALPGGTRARVSAFADDVTVFVSCHTDVQAVVEALARYEKVTGAVFNRSKSVGLRLGAWTGVNSLPGIFSWTDGPVRILGVWFGPGLQLEKNWSEVQIKVESAVKTWVRRKLSLKGRAEACATYVFPLILYRLSVLPLPARRLTRLQGHLDSLLWDEGKHYVCREVCVQSAGEGGLGQPSLLCHKNAERLTFLGRSLEEDAPWVPVVENSFPNLKPDPSVEGRRRPKGESRFFSECRTALRALPGTSVLDQPRKRLYRDLVEGTAKDPLCRQMGWLMEVVRSQWNWAPGQGFSE